MAMPGRSTYSLLLSPGRRLIRGPLLALLVPAEGEESVLRGELGGEANSRAQLSQACIRSAIQ